MLSSCIYKYLLFTSFLNFVVSHVYSQQEIFEVPMKWIMNYIEPVFNRLLLWFYWFCFIQIFMKRFYHLYRVQLEHVLVPIVVEAVWTNNHRKYFNSSELSWAWMALILLLLWYFASFRSYSLYFRYGTGFKTNVKLLLSMVWPVYCYVFVLQFYVVVLCL